MKTLSRLLVVFAAVVSAGSVAAADTHMFLAKHCLDCHGAEEQKAGMRLDGLSQNLADPEVLRRWVGLFDRVAKREMPPRDAAQPTDAERDAFVATLRGKLTEADRRQVAELGRRSVRRLNRTEYEHTLRDLLALPLLRVKELLPEDGQEFGFDKTAGALDISPVQMTKYLQASDVALRQAIVRETKAPQTTVWREPAANQSTARSAIAIHCAVPLQGRELADGLKTHIVGDPINDYGNSYRAATFQGEADSVALLTGVIGAHQPEGLQIDRFKPTVSGWYRVRFSTWSLRWERTKAAPAVRGLSRNYTIFEPPAAKNAAGRWEYPRLKEEMPDAGRLENVEFYGETEATHVLRASLKGDVLGFFDAPSLQPKVHEFRVWLNPGERISFHPMTLPAVGARNSGVHEGVRSYEGPGVALDWFEVEGPLVEQWPPESQRRLFGEVPTNADGTSPVADVRALLTTFATRAFRRPVEPVEIETYATIVDQQLARGMSFEESLLAGYKALLCSPDFLFVGLEGEASPDFALASRLSYFLWNSMPDAPLLALAQRGELNEPETLHAEVERMLNDPRSERFVEHFLDEWLEMKKIDFTTPDPQLYPEFDPWLRDSMLAETRAYFQKLLTDDLGVDHLIASDFLMINQRLAELYGIRGVNGSEIRSVPVPAGSHRGGLLTQAAVLKVTANGTATSPVLRGVWVIERLLGIPRQPPPPNIPAVEPDATGAVTIRQMIEQHRADPACASCHAKMDPPGMALESFDVIGGYRDRYRLSGKPKRIRKGKEFIEEPSIEVVNAASKTIRVKLRLGSEVDSTGELEDGSKFEDVDGLRKLLLADRDSLARNVVRQLTIYGTGSGIRFSDRNEIDAIVARTREQKHGIRSLVHAVVQSEIFRGSN